MQNSLHRSHEQLLADKKIKSPKPYLSADRSLGWQMSCDEPTAERQDSVHNSHKQLSADKILSYPSLIYQLIEAESKKKRAENLMLCFDKSKESAVFAIILRRFLVIFSTPTFISFTKLKIRRSFWGAEQV